MGLRTKEMAQREFNPNLGAFLGSLIQVCLSVKVKDGCFDSWLPCLYESSFFRTCLHSISKPFDNISLLKSNNFNLLVEIYLRTNFFSWAKYGFISVIVQKIPFLHEKWVRNIALGKATCIVYLLKEINLQSTSVCLCVLLLIFCYWELI